MNIALLIFLVGFAGVINTQRRVTQPYIEVSILYVYNSQEYRLNDTPPIHNLKITVFENERETDTIVFHEEVNQRQRYELMLGAGSPVHNGVNGQQKVYAFKQEYLPRNASQVSVLLRTISSVKRRIQTGTYTNRSNAALQILQDTLKDFSPRSNQSIHETIEDWFKKLR